MGQYTMCNERENIKTDCIEKYNEGLIDPISEVVPKVIVVLHYLSIVICIMCFKWRYLADALYPMTITMFMLLSFNVSQWSHDNDAVGVAYINLLIYLGAS